MIKDLSKEFAEFHKVRCNIMERKLEDLTAEQVANRLDEIKQAAREFYGHVYEATKEINPSLPEMINSGHFDDFYLFSSTMCYLQRNFNIRGTAQHCQQCGQTH